MSGSIHGKRIEFTVVDLGVGIPENVSRYLRHKISAIAAIEWAMSNENTTRSGDVPGGLGLKIIREFSERNSGTMVILSNRGIWAQSGQEVERTPLGPIFPGTLVHLSITTANLSNYDETRGTSSQLIL